MTGSASLQADGTDDPATLSGAPDVDGAGQLHDREFWAVENLKYAAPHYRLVEVARLVRRIANGRPCTLLDVGCGPATLKRFLPSTVQYHGIDIAIQEPAPYLRESDILASPITFDDERFDIIVAQGLFEYLGGMQEEKLADLALLLKPHGTFLTSYVNFGHMKAHICSSYSNVQPLLAFRQSLERHFRVDRTFPVCHNWNPTPPNRSIIKLANSLAPWNIPVVSPLLAVEYFYVCSGLGSDRQT